MNNTFFITVRDCAVMLATVGYALFASFSAALTLPSTPIAIAARGAGVALCLLAVLPLRRPHGSTLSFWLFVSAMIFWTLYALRMSYDTYWHSYALLFSPEEYWIWGVGGCLVPMVCFSLMRIGWGEDAVRPYLLTLLAGLAACVMSMTSLSTFVEDASGGYDTGRAGLATLNPISLGHLGAQVILLALWRIYLAPQRNTAKVTALSIAAIAVGGFILLSSNSRGPFVALVGALAFALLASSTRRKYFILAMLGLFAVALPYLAVAVDNVAGTQIAERLLGQSQLDDVNTQSRFALFLSANRHFLRNPLLGSGLEDPTFGGYPHNLVIEAFMATGLLGGVLFIIMLGLAAIASFRLLRVHSAYGWVSLLLVQQMVAVQFSGSLAQSTTLWALIGMATSLTAGRAILPNGQGAHTPPGPPPPPLSYRHAPEGHVT